MSKLIAINESTNHFRIYKILLIGMSSGFNFPRTSHFRAAEKRQNVKMYRPDNGMIVISVIKKLSWIFEKYITREYGINNIHGKRITNSNATV
jgi:hypothetical protein